MTAFEPSSSPLSLQNDLEAAWPLLRQEVSSGTDLVLPGLVKGQRFNPWWGGYEREENNIFFGFCVAYVLQRMAPAWPEQYKVEVQQIIDGLSAQLRWFQNPHDGLSFNYWPRFPAGHFPNGKFYHLSSQFKASDDIDDTGYALSLWGPQLLDIDALTRKISPFCQGVVRQNSKTPTVLSSLPAYNTWMGHHMAVDVDVCVLANYLPPILASKQDLNRYDEASLNFLLKVVEERWYLKIPHLVCGYYLRVPIMTYHIARNLNLLPEPWQGKIKKALVRDWEQILTTQAEHMHALVLDTAAMYLDIDWQAEPMTLAEAQQPYTCYYMGMLTAVDRPMVNWLAPYGLFQVRKRCPALNLAFWLENQTLKTGYRPGPLWWT